MNNTYKGTMGFVEAENVFHLKSENNDVLTRFKVANYIGDHTDSNYPYTFPEGPIYPYVGRYQEESEELVELEFEEVHVAAPAITAYEREGGWVDISDDTPDDIINIITSAGYVAASASEIKNQKVLSSGRKPEKLNEVFFVNDVDDLPFVPDRDDKLELRCFQSAMEDVLQSDKNDDIFYFFDKNKLEFGENPIETFPEPQNIALSDEQMVTLKGLSGNDFSSKLAASLTAVSQSAGGESPAEPKVSKKNTFKP